MNSIENITRITSIIQKKILNPPILSLVLGTGLNGLAESITEPTIIPYADLPGWPQSTVLGHAGRLILGNLEGVPVITMQGRAHFYEGYDMSLVTLPIRVFQKLGVDILMVTNAAGAIHPDFSPGEVMLITDHINLMGMTGQNPLIGPNLSEFGPRFPDMSQAYDRDLLRLAREAALDHKLKIREGVYAGLSGPSFETPADLRFLRIIGADAVGMSTVPEVIVARHGGMRVLGFSGISNKANLDGDTITSHEEVLEAGNVLVPKMEVLIRGVIHKLSQQND